MTMIPFLDKALHLAGLTVWTAAGRVVASLRRVRRDRCMGNRSGVALLLVIGLVSVLMISAVAFSISMRIERQGSFNYRHGVMARHMLWASLSQAITNINGMLDNESGLQIYPQNDIMYSMLESYDETNRVRVLSAAATNFIPLSLFNEAKGMNVFWHSLYDTNNSKVGRCAFLAVNRSGLLDANYAGGLARGAGTNAQEIQLSQLPEMMSLTVFTNNRQYETRGELVSLNAGTGLKASPDNMTVFSLARNDQVVNSGGIAVGQKVYVGSSTFNNSAAISNAFSDCGLTPAEKATAYRSLTDYVDPDSIPTNLAAGCAEPVPMINEMDFTYMLTVHSNKNYELSYLVEIEWFYPFDTVSSDIFKMDWKADFVAGGGGGGNNHIVLVPAALASNNEEVAVANLRHSYSTVLGSREIAGTLPTEGNFSIDFSIEVKAKIRLGASEVDSVPFPYSAEGIKIPVHIEFAFPGPTAPPVSITSNYWSECIDPRFNWDPVGNSGVQWISGADCLSYPGAAAIAGASPGAENHLLTFLFQRPQELYDATGSTSDGDTWLHVANKKLQTAGELGYICIGPWSSIRLFDHNFHPAGTPAYHTVLDHFTVNSNAYVKGAVNLNTTNATVLASVFMGVPDDAVPTLHTMIWDKAYDIAQSLISQRPYYNLSSMATGAVWTSYIDGGAGAPKIVKDSIIRNSADLLTCRENCFTIFLVADSYAEGSAGGRGRSLATSRAVAEIWRDPVRSMNNTHGCFVRYFKVFDN